MTTSHTLEEDFNLTCKRCNESKRRKEQMTRKFAIIFEDGTIGHVDAVKALQDGEWKDIAFPEMQRKAHMTITEDVMRS